MARTKEAGRKSGQTKADLSQDAAAESPARAEGPEHFSGEKRKISSMPAGEGGKDSENPKVPSGEPDSQQADGETPGWPTEPSEEAQPKKKRKKTRSKMKNLKKDNRDESQKPKYYKEGWNQKLQRSKGSSGGAGNKHTSFF